MRDLSSEGALDRTVDPVAEAGEYQRLLLRFLGDRDPALVQAELADQVAQVMADSGSLAATRPEPEEWSVLECLAHILDAEIVVSGRYRWILAEDEPPLSGYDQDLWVDRLHHPDDDPQEMLSVLRALRRANLDLWHRTPMQYRSRVGMQSERGPESYDLTFRLMAGHGLFHLAQMRRALAAVRGEV
jgi:hypothetical protein